MLDFRFGRFSYLLNFLLGYGCNFVKKFYKWFGDLLEKKMGNIDVIFEEVFWFSCCLWFYESLIKILGIISMIKDFSLNKIIKVVKYIK